MSKRTGCWLLLYVCGALAVGCARGPSGLDAPLDAAVGAIDVRDAGEDPIDAAVAEPALPDAAAEPARDSGQPDAEVDATVVCGEETTCLVPRPLGSVSGDSGKDRVEDSGHLSTFFSVTATEDDHFPLVPRRLRLSITLASSGADYDLYVYPEGTGCTGQTQSSTDGGLTENVEVSWSDTQGQDSGRTVLIEVRHREGVCDISRPFSLVVVGN